MTFNDKIFTAAHRLGQLSLFDKLNSIKYFCTPRPIVKFIITISGNGTSGNHAETIKNGKIVFDVQVKNTSIFGGWYWVLKYYDPFYIDSLIIKQGNKED